MLAALKHKSAQKSLHAEAKNRAANLIKGILRYQETPYARDVAEPPCIWKKGSSRLLNYATQTNGEVVLFIPSLINRYYILDLEKERSMLRYMAAQGLQPLVLDWGSPGDAERKWNVADYITQILLPVIDFLHQTSGQKVNVVGYCMGGVLALAATQLRPKKIQKLGLLATPWDFHCKAFMPFVLGSEWQNTLKSLITHRSFLPADIIQSLFYLTDPFVFEHKFLRFLEMDAESRAAKDFIALEHWVNDGVDMTQGVAHDCLIGWAQQNQLAGGKWQVADKKIEPKTLKHETFIAIPKNDHVVPFDCALPLAHRIKTAQMIHPSSGHVGMIVGRNAKRELWNPLVEFLQS